MRLCQQLQYIRESPTIALADRVRKLKAEGKQVIALQTGDPDFATPTPIVEAAQQALQDGFTHYSNSRGLPELREIISHQLAQKYQVHYDPESEILVTNGGVHAYFCALRAILDPDDEVLVPDPTWITHANVVTLLGGQKKRVASRAEYDFWPQIEDWEQAVSEKTVALVINSPHNPTASVASAEYLHEVMRFAIRHNLYVISDEVYQTIMFDGRPHVCVASLPEARERTLLINSLSKSYAMTGWRVGYLAAPANVISQALKVSQHTITNVAPFVQKAAICALTDPQVTVALKQMVAHYQQRRDLALDIIKTQHDAGVRVIDPQGAFYLFLDVRQLGNSSMTIAEQLLNDALVSVVPGVAFGNCGEGFVRMTIAASEEEIETGLRKLLKWASQR